jgi:hypothetical protein
MFIDEYELSSLGLVISAEMFQSFVRVEGPDGENHATVPTMLVLVISHSHPSSTTESVLVCWISVTSLKVVGARVPVDTFQKVSDIPQ